MKQRIALYGPPSGNVLDKAFDERQTDVTRNENAMEDYKKRHNITLVDAELRNAFAQELQIRQQMLQTEVALTQAQGKDQSEDPMSELSSETRSDLRATMAGLTKAKAELGNKVVEVQEKIRALEGHKVEVERLDGELQSSRKQLRSIRDKVDEMRLERALTDARWSNVKVIEPPHALETSPSLPPVLKILVAGFLGLIASVGLLLGLSMMHFRAAAAGDLPAK